MTFLFIIFILLIAYLIFKPSNDKKYKKMLNELANCNLKAAAFDILKSLQGGIYKKDMTEALDLFIKLPCPETAINLIEVVPQFTPIMTSANDFLVKTTAVENRGPKFQGYDEWIQSFDNNLLASNKIHSFLMNESLTCKIKIGFHRMRDQSIILKRLNQIGIKKDFFSDHRQFIRDIVAKNESAFRSIIDMVCIHGVHNGKEKFWNGLGAEQDSNHYQISEIMFEVSPVIDPFVSIINEINKNS